MNSQNLLFSLCNRELNGVFKLNKPLRSFALSSLIGFDRYWDTFFGFTIGCDFIISLGFESIDNDSFFTNSYKKVSLNFNTSPISGGKVDIFHQIYLGSFQNLEYHFHFYQNINNCDIFVVSISEIDSDFLIIVYGNLPRLSCVNCQSKTCKHHGIISRFSYQLPTSTIDYVNKIHQLTAIYTQNDSLILIVGDCEANIRFVTVSFPISIVNYHSYPSSSFPLSVRVEGRKIIENECDCFYDYDKVDKKTNCMEASMCPKISPSSFKCQRCLSLHCYNTLTSSSSNNNNNNVHESLPSTIVDFIHDINPSNVDHKRALLPLRQSVYSCAPCCKKTFLTDIHASYQTLLLYKYDDDDNGNNSNSHLTTEYDDIHGEVLGANTAGYRGSYNWRSEPPATSTAPVIITEELVFNTSSWCKDQSSVHCLGIASGKLELSNKLLVHLVEDGTDNSQLVELDINCGSVKTIFTTSSSSSKLCDFIIKAKHRDTKVVLDLNNDLQVTKGQSLDVIRDHHGVVEFTH